METLIAIKNGKIVTPDEVIEGKVLLIEEDCIVGIVEKIIEEEKVIDAHGSYIIPGFIDIHSDRIEQIILPRPTAQMDMELALRECERELLNQGITTMFHSLSLYKDEFFGKSPLRTKESIDKLVALLQSRNTQKHLIHHYLHLRIEIDNLEAFDVVKEMICANMVQEISFMDHTPGQGQYGDLKVYEETVKKYHGTEVESEGMEGILQYHKTKDRMTVDQLKELCDLAHQYGIRVASHDDDTKEKLMINKKIGVDISEFPINVETAKEAKKEGFYTVVGAPNILLGGSHSGNMSAAEAIQEDCADILCSDYYPPAILYGIFHMYHTYSVPLSEVVKKATLNPAKATGISEEYGSIEKGKKADLLIVDEFDNYPVITKVFIHGKTVSNIAYHE